MERCGFCGVYVSCVRARVAPDALTLFVISQRPVSCRVCTVLGFHDTDYGYSFLIENTKLDLIMIHIERRNDFGHCSALFFGRCSALAEATQAGVRVQSAHTGPSKAC